MTKRTGIEVRFFTVAQMLRVSYGFWPVSITMTPSCVRMMPAFELEAPSGVDVDAVGELLDLRTEILSARGADEHA